MFAGKEKNHGRRNSEGGYQQRCGTSPAPSRHVRCDEKLAIYKSRNMLPIFEKIRVVSLPPFHFSFLPNAAFATGS
jgi:hypothetical protein